MGLDPIIVPAGWTSEKDFQPFPVFQFIQFGLVEPGTDPSTSSVSSSRLFIGGQTKLDWAATATTASLSTYAATAHLGVTLGPKPHTHSWDSQSCVRCSGSVLLSLKNEPGRTNQVSQKILTTEQKTKTKNSNRNIQQYANKKHHNDRRARQPID